MTVYEIRISSADQAILEKLLTFCQFFVLSSKVHDGTGRIALSSTLDRLTPGSQAFPALCVGERWCSSISPRRTDVKARGKCSTVGVKVSNLGGLLASANTVIGEFLLSAAISLESSQAKGRKSLSTARTGSAIPESSTLLPSHSNQLKVLCRNMRNRCARGISPTARK